MPTINQRLATQAGARSFNEDLADRVRRHHFEVAEAILIEHLASLAEPAAAAARACRLEEVRIHGWDEINAETARLARQTGAVQSQRFGQ